MDILKEGIQRFCKVCNKEFYTFDLKRVCCSEPCSIENISGHTATSNLDKEATCEQCKESFKTKWAKICPKCRYSNKKKKMTEGRRAKNPTYKCRQCLRIFPCPVDKPKPYKCPKCTIYVEKKVAYATCKICKKGFMVENPNSKTCSPECSAALEKKSNRIRRMRWYDKKRGK